MDLDDLIDLGRFVSSAIFVIREACVPLFRWAQRNKKDGSPQRTCGSRRQMILHRRR